MSEVAEPVTPRPRKRIRRQKNDMPPPPDLSEEQAEMLKVIVEEGKNGLVIARAGSGKSYMSLRVAEQFYEKHQERTLLLTYNTRLKLDTRRRIQELHLDGAIEAHSYHAAAGKFFAGKDYQGSADNELIQFACARPPNQKLVFGLLIIDEAQDMNPLYARFVQHILKHCEKPPLMMLVGDPFQRIFGFNGATCDYMVEPQKFFAEHLRCEEFVTRHLTISWRITHEMAQFINTHLNPCSLQYSAEPKWWAEHGEQITAWWGPGIHANPHRAPAPGSVEQRRGKFANKGVMKLTQKMFAEFGNDEVALLSFSLKSERSPLRVLVKEMGKNQHENWILLMGTGLDASDDMMRGKRVASTIHRFKGLERRGILVVGLDAFFEGRFPDPLPLYNLFYVACTRAKDKLIVMITNKDYATMRCAPLKRQPDRKNELLLRQLTEYVPFDEWLGTQEHLFTLTEIQVSGLVAKEVDSSITHVKGRQPGTTENLKPFLAEAIKYRLRLNRHGTLPVLPAVNSREVDASLVEFMQMAQSDREPHSWTWAELVELAVAVDALETRYLTNWRQIHDYEQITPTAFLDTCVANCEALIQSLGPDAHWEFSRPVMAYFKAPWFKKEYIDVLTDKVDVVVNGEHIMQLVVANELDVETLLYAKLMQCMAPGTQHAYVMLMNQGRLVRIDLKPTALVEDVPIEYELLNRCIRRKLHKPPPTEKTLKADAKFFK